MTQVQQYHLILYSVFWHLTLPGGKQKLTDWYSVELQLNPVIVLIPVLSFIVSAQEAESSGQPFPRHCLKVLWASSICLHRVPRQVSNTHWYKPDRAKQGHGTQTQNQEQVVCKAGTCIFFPLPTHQSDPPPPILLHCLLCLSIPCSCTGLCLHCGRNVSH